MGVCYRIVQIFLLSVLQTFRPIISRDNIGWIGCLGINKIKNYKCFFLSSMHA